MATIINCNIYLDRYATNFKNKQGIEGLIVFAFSLLSFSMIFYDKFLSGAIIFLGITISIIYYFYKKYLIYDSFYPLPYVILYVFIGIFIRGILLKYEISNNHYLAPVDEYGIYVFLIGCTSLVSLTFGFVAVKKNKNCKKILKINESIINKKLAINIFLLLCALVGFIAAILFTIKYRWIFVGEYSLLEKRYIFLEGGSSYLTILRYFPIVGCMIASGGKIKPENKIYFIINFSLILYWVIYLGSKSTIFELIFYFLIFRNYKIKKINIKQIFIIGIVAIFVFGLLDVYISYQNNIIFRLNEDNIFKATFLPLFDRAYHFDMISIILSKVNSISSLLLGKSFSELLYFFVPRELWADKPLSFGYEFGKLYLNSYAYYKTSFAVPLIGELYLNYHLVGVCIGMFIYGALLKYIYLYINKNNYIGSVIYAVLLFRLIHMVEGPLSSHIIFLIGNMLPILAFIIINKVIVEDCKVKVNRN